MISSSSAGPAVSKRPGRALLIGIGLLFIVPFLAAYALYYWLPSLTPQHRINKGYLNDPARPVPALNLTDAAGQPLAADLLKGHWSFVLIGGTRCDAGCVDRLYITRQIRTRLAKDRERLQRVYIAPDAAALEAVRSTLAAEHPDLIWAVDADVAGHRAADFFTGPAGPDGLFLLDPLGNWVLSYKPKILHSVLTYEPEEPYTDLKKLLPLSSIG
jgi:hypothetical protein